MNWKNYNDVYDMYINGSKIQRLWGKKHALHQAELQAGNLFETRRVELVNIHTGEVIFNT